MPSPSKRKRSPSPSNPTVAPPPEDRTPSPPITDVSRNQSSEGGSYEANGGSEVDEKPKRKKVKGKAGTKANGTGKSQGAGRVNGKTKREPAVKDEFDTDLDKEDLGSSKASRGGSMGSPSTQAWSADELQRLFFLTYTENPRHNWKEIAKHFPGRTQTSVGLIFGRKVKTQAGKIVPK